MAWRQATVSYLLKSDVLMFEWKYSLLSLASKKIKKKRISSVLILSMEIPIVSQWTMYVSHRFSSYNEVLLKKRLVVIIQLESKSTLFFLVGLISLFAALGLRSLDSKQKFHNLYKVSAIVRMVVTQWYFWWGKFGSSGREEITRTPAEWGKSVRLLGFVLAICEQQTNLLSERG